MILAVILRGAGSGGNGAGGLGLLALIAVVFLCSCGPRMWREHRAQRRREEWERKRRQAVADQLK